MCVGRDWCATPDENTKIMNATVKYFGKDAILVCGSLKVFVAISVGFISAYLAI